MRRLLCMDASIVDLSVRVPINRGGGSNDNTRRRGSCQAPTGNSGRQRGADYVSRHQRARPGRHSPTSLPGPEPGTMSDTTNRPRYIYFFGDGQAEAGDDLKHLVGGKGASLAEMTRAGLNVPPGFTISAECCDLYYRTGKQWPPGLEDDIRAQLQRLEQLTGRTFGRGGDPLLVAVRSGAAQSMPGMMDTVLNVGLNPDCVAAMGQRTENPRGAWEAYR